MAIRSAVGVTWRAMSALAAALLAGCVARGDIQDHVGRIDQSVGTARNRSILLNIVRASRDEPLYFTSLPSVSGQGTASLSTGLPTITLGPGQTDAQRQFAVSNSLFNQSVSSFDVGVLESKNFYDGLLRPITLPEANLIMHQGYARALVFSVLVDKIRVTTRDGVAEIHNDPTSATDFRRFQEYLYLAVYYGLTTEAHAGPDGKPQGSLCFDEALAGAEQQAFVRRSPIQCQRGPAGKRPIGAAELSFVIDGKPQTIEIILRSPNQIFQYLGGMADPAAAGQKVALFGDQPGTPAEPLLVLTKDALASCFARVAYGGQVYCVPNAGSDNTKRIFQILNQILALNTAPEDIPPTQSIYITR